MFIYFIFFLVTQRILSLSCALFSVFQYRTAETFRWPADSCRGVGGCAEGVPQREPGLQNSSSALRRRRAPELPGGPFQHHGRDSFPFDSEGPRTSVHFLKGIFIVFVEVAFNGSSQIPRQSCPESGGGSPRSLEEDEDDGDTKEKALQTEALLCAFETLGKSWPRNPETQGKSEIPLPANPKDE